MNSVLRRFHWSHFRVPTYTTVMHVSWKHSAAGTTATTDVRMYFLQAKRVTGKLGLDSASEFVSDLELELAFLAWFITRSRDFFRMRTTHGFMDLYPSKLGILLMIWKNYCFVVIFV